MSKKMIAILVTFMICISYIIIPAFGKEVIPNKSVPEDISEQESILNDLFSTEYSVFGVTFDKDDLEQAYILYKSSSSITESSADEWYNGIREDVQFWELHFENDITAKVGKRGDNWYLSGISRPSGEVPNGKVIILTDGMIPKDCLEICYVDLAEIQTEVAVMKCKSGLVLVPFGNRPNLTGLKNGVPYSYEEVRAAVTKSNTAPSDPKESESVSVQNENDGFGDVKEDSVVQEIIDISNDSDTDSQLGLFIPIVGVLAIISVSLVVVIILVRKNKDDSDR